MSGKHTRREILSGAGVLAGAAAAGSIAGPALAESGPAAAPAWDQEADVVCVGSGAAALAAAVSATLEGARAIVFEKMPITGGTTAKSGGVTWVPDNPLMRARGLVDERGDCLRYMARYSYPRSYTPDSPTLGLTELQYRLLAAVYDNGSAMVDALQKAKATQFREFRMWQLDTSPPDYADHLPEDKVPRGRGLEPAVGYGSSTGGASLVSQLEQWLLERKVPVLTDHRVVAVLKEGGRVTGVEVEHAGKRLRVRARRGVVFGTGGFAHNTELVALHQQSLYGACAMPGSTGDFIAIAQAAGAAMGSLHTAWRSEVVLEEALENRAVGFGAFVLPGDSMVVVNRYGKRIVNEKRNYNDRTHVHFVFDPAKTEYPNHLTFIVFDARSLDAFGGAFPIPLDRREARFMIEGVTLKELSANIRQRLARVAKHTGGVALDDGFDDALARTVADFNGYAKAGKDPEFGRGSHQYDIDWHRLFSARRPGATVPENTLPNLTMYPFAESGPYYAFILGAGALDTNGGPLIDEQARVLGADGTPIPGLYGAGNCIASPAHTAYYAAGGTIGLALTFGYIAGRNASRGAAA